MKLPILRSSALASAMRISANFRALTLTISIFECNYNSRFYRYSVHTCKYTFHDIAYLQSAYDHLASLNSYSDAHWFIYSVLRKDKSIEIAGGYRQTNRKPSWV